MRLFPYVLPLLFVIPACSAAPSETTDDESTDELTSTMTDADLEKAITSAADGVLFTSESDYPFDFVSAPLAKGEKGRIDEALVRKKLAAVIDAHPAADKPLATLHGETQTFASWKQRFAHCTPDSSPDPATCDAMKKLDAILEKNLWGEKVFLFGSVERAGHVDGIGVTIVIVGRTPQGNLAGVRTIAIWT